MAEIVLKPELIKGLQKVLVDYEPENEDPILAAQYLSAVVGSIVATSGIPEKDQNDILNQLIDFIKYVYEEQRKAGTSSSGSETSPSPQSAQDSFGKWPPN